MPSRYEVWEDGEWTKDIPIERDIGGPAFRSPHSDHLLQMADLIAHTLLKQAEEPSPRVERLGVAQAFGILDRALRTPKASSGGEGEALGSPLSFALRPRSACRNPQPHP